MTIAGAVRADNASTSVLLRKAIHASAVRQYEEATRLYRELCALAPEDGYPLYARYLARTGQTTAVAELSSELPRLPLTPLTRARTAIALGHTTAAIDTLAYALTPSDLYARTVLLEGLLRGQGEVERARRVVVEALQRPELSASQRVDLFQRLVADASPDALAEVVLDVLAQLTEVEELDSPQVRELANAALNACDGKPGYSQMRTMLAEKASTSAVAAYLTALASQRSGNVLFAQTVLERAWRETSGTRISAWVGEELATSYVGQPDKIEQIYRAILPNAKNPHRIRLLLAQILFKQKRYPETCALLEEIDRTKLDELQRRLLANLRLTAMAKFAPAGDVVRAFENEAAGKPWEELRELAEAPFALLPETHQHLEFRKALQARLRETTAPPELLILMLSTEHQLRSQEAMVAALRAYVEARPTDYAALDEYATAAGARAYQLATGPHETTPPLEQIQTAVDEAARALWKVIQSRPYALEPYQKLMELYMACQRPDKAREVPLALARHTSATAEEIHLAAYLLSQEGFTTDSLPLYEEAIRRAPQIGRFKMNLAYAYQALGRNAEAMEIYKRLFLEGSFGRQHHIHQLTEDAYALAEKMGQVDALLAFWNELRTKSDVPQRKEFLEHVALLLKTKKRYADAVTFAETVLREIPEEQDAAEQLLADLSLAQGDLERARKIYRDRVARARTEAEKIAERNAFAALLAAYSLYDQAIEEWVAVARDYPTASAAGRAYLFAAQAALLAKNVGRAKDLLRKYESRDYGDSDGERMARELSAKLDELQLKNPATSSSPLK